MRLANSLFASLDEDDAVADQVRTARETLVVAQTPESSPAGLDELTRLVEHGKLKIEVSGERPLDQARALLDEGEKHAANSFCAQRL